MILKIIELLKLTIYGYTMYLIIARIPGDLSTVHFIRKSKELSYQKQIKKAFNHKLFFFLNGNPAFTRITYLINNRQVMQYGYNKLMENLKLDLEKIEHQFTYTIDGNSVNVKQYYNSLTSETEYVETDYRTRISILNSFVFSNKLFYFDFTNSLDCIDIYRRFEKYDMNNISENSVFYKYKVEDNYRIKMQPRTKLVLARTEMLQEKNKQGENNV